MPASHLDEVRDYRFADRALALRKRAGLTQHDLGALLGLTERSVGAWETGLTYPGAERLRQLIALYLERGAFVAGREAEEAAALWEAARERAARRLAPFDPTWFASVRDAAGVPSPPVLAADLPPPRHEWGEAPDVGVLHGRSHELATLARWVGAERCRLVAVLGAGGIGKTALVARLARDLAPGFPVVYWRSLRNAPPVEEWLAGAIAALSGAQVLPPEGLDARLGMLLAQLRERRALLVLDNLETVLEPEAPALRYRVGYEGYGEVLRRLGASAHQGCLLLTSREKPLREGGAAVRALRLGGLGVEDGRALLAGRALAGDDATWQSLVGRYAGNPLALGVVGETVGAVFGGDIAAFLAQEVAVFGDIRQLLDEQVARLSALERAIVTWLAVEREPVGFAELVVDLGPGVARTHIVEAVEALGRRSLLEAGARGTFTVQPVVLEYATVRLVEQVSAEVVTGEPALLLSQALVKAQTRDYVRRSQERMIAQPLLERLSLNLGSAEEVERELLALLEAWRGRPEGGQGYGPGNVVNLLRLLRGELRGVDLSRLVVRQAYLQGVEAQDASLVRAHLADAVLAEAFDAPMSVALSADGESLVAGTSTGEVYLWRVPDRTLLLAVQGHAGSVPGVALSADGQIMASGSFDGTVKLWETGSGRPRATLEGHSGLVYDVALSADGRLVASGSFDGTVKLWEAASGRPLATLQGHTGGVWGVALSGDGQLVAGGSYDGLVKLWEVGSGRLRATLEGHIGGILDVALSADGRIMASGSYDGTVKLWEAPSGRPLATLQGHTGAVGGVALSSDGRLVASVSEDRTVRLWEAPSGRPMATLQGHTSAVRAVALNADGRLLASASYDGTARLWEVGSGWLLATLQGHTGAVGGVALSGDGQIVASGSYDGTVRLWESGTGQLLATLHEHNGAVMGVALSEDGRLVASGSQDGTVRLWESGGGQLRATLHGHSSGVRAVALSADGRLVASSSEDGTVRLWEALSGRPLAALQGPTGGVWGVALSADSRIVASGGVDGSVKLWEVGSGRLLATPQGHSSGVHDVALSADSRIVASGSLDGSVKLWEVGSGRLLATLQGHTGAVGGVALSGDGRLVASVSEDRTVRLWEAPSGRPLATLQGHTSEVRAVALSADGQMVASGSFDGTIKLWEARSGACLRTLRADRRYERLDITGLTGVTEAQRATLLALGGVDKGI